MTVKKTLLALSSVVVFLGAAPATIPKLDETIEVSIVNLDVIVTDREGKRVRGLTAADFEILENSKPQAISNFTEYRSAAEGGSVSVEGRTTEQAVPREPRTVVVFLESMTLTAAEATKFTAAIRDALKQTVRPGDAVSVVIWSRSAISSTAFTDDLTVVDAALAEYEALAGRAVANSVVQQEQFLRAVRDFEIGVAERVAQARAGRSLGGTNAAPLVETKDIAGDANTLLDHAAPMLMARGEMKLRVSAINSTIDMMAGAEGRKVLLLATHRLGEIAGAEYLYSSGVTLIPGTIRNEFATEDLTRSLIDKANASGVTIYPMFPEGIRANYVDASIGQITLPTGGQAMDTGVSLGAENFTAMNETVNLDRIARETGGVMAWSVADIVRVLPEISSDMTDYYSLAYRVTASRTDRARDIVVKAKNRDYRVRARRQFVEKSDETLMKDRLTATLFGVTPHSDIPLEVRQGEVRKVRTRTSIPLAVKIPINALTSLREGNAYKGGFSVYVATAADLDEVSDFTKRTQPFEFAAADLEKANAGHFTYDLDLVVNGKARYIAVGVYDEVGKSSGFLRIPVASRARGAEEETRAGAR